VKTSRPVRVAAALKRHLAPLLSLHAGGAVVTLSNVELSPDLTVARVYVSVLGGDARAFEKLAAKVKTLRGEIGRAIGLSRVPELRLVRDESLDFQARLADIVREDEERHVGDES
jgi:ribosome-binding factor A